MKNHKICMKLITLLLCFAMTFAAPLTVLAGEEEDIRPVPASPSEEPSPDNETYVFAIEIPEQALVAEPAPEADPVPDTTDPIPDTTDPVPAETDPVPAAESVTPTETPEETPAETPAETPEETPVETPVEMPAEIPMVSLTADPAPAESEIPAAQDSAVPAAEDSEVPAVEDSEVSETEGAGLPTVEYEFLSEDEYEGSSDGTGIEKLIDDIFTDAEKYYEADYDKNLCWAATAANMLWDGNYAQQAINPLTKTYFKSEDEVFDYFRKCFNDVGASPDIAIEYFIDGTCNIATKKGRTDLFRSDAPLGGLLKGALSEGDVKMINYDDGNPLYMLNDMKDLSAGMLIRWWITDDQKFTRNAHWLTVVSVERNEQGQFKGIWLANSDNDVATRAGKKGNTPDEKAKLASEMPNSITYYDVESRIVNYRSYWVVVDYSKTNTVVVWYVCTLADNDYDYDPEEPEDWDDWEDEDEPNDSVNLDDWDDWDDTDDDERDRRIPEDIEKRIRDLIEKERSEEDDSDDDHSDGNADDSTDYVEVIVLDYDMINEGMIENNLETFSFTNGAYNKLTDTTYKMIIRRDPATLKSVSVDGNRISDYSVRDLSNGSFEINIGSSLLRSLEPGTHTLKMEFAGSKDIVTTFEVK